MLAWVVVGIGLECGVVEDEMYEFWSGVCEDRKDEEHCYASEAVHDSELMSDRGCDAGLSWVLGSRSYLRQRHCTKVRSVNVK